MTDVLGRLADALHSKYRLDREVGAGGMATVYLAHDLRHERDVAIKVLHPDLAAALGAERFLAEIKTTAKLQHPHILPLLDSGEADGLLFYVMPYVAGESLRTRLERETQLSVDDSVRIAREVASAIESAHKQGIVHRDIKPENILLHEDQALVADFGIALAVSAAGGARMTQTGLSLGTPQYMAPEQAMGERVIDGRADIYALGAVTYEMLVGEAPFTGPSVQAIVARVMTEEPRPVTGQRRSVPQNVNAAVMKALEKLPADRFSSAADFSRALASTDYGVATAAAPVIAPPKPVQSRALNWMPWGVAAMATIAAVAVGMRAFSHPPEKAIHLAVDMPQNVELPPSVVDMLGISPDGNTIAFGAVVDGRPQLLLRRLDSDSLTAVKAPAVSQGSAEFSPNGQWLAFNGDRKIWKVGVSGGVPAPITDAGWGQLAWIENDEIVYTPNYDKGLYRISAEGGTPAALTTPDRKKGELGHWWPQMLPDGDHVLFTNYTTPANKSSIEVISLKSGKREVIYRGGYFGRYVDGHLLFSRDAALMEIPFDAGSLKTKGTPLALPIEVETRASNGWSAFAVSPNGTLAYREDVLKNVEVVWTDLNGNEEPALDSTARITGALVSPDGRKIALGKDGDVWIYDRQRGVYTRLTNTEQVEYNFLWTRDSREILYSRDVPQYDVFKRAVDASTPEQLVLTSVHDKFAWGITPDGKSIIYEEDELGGADLFIGPFNPADNSGRTRVAGGAGQQSNAALSPDSRWLTYTSTESGRGEVYVAAFPVGRGPARQQVSVSGASISAWSPDGRTIYFRSGERFWRVTFDAATGDIGKPELVSKVRPGFDWSIGPDGRFLISKLAKGGEHRSLKIILNWMSTLKDIPRHSK